MCSDYDFLFQAIYHAVKVWKVDIIVMSFSFEDDEPEIDPALHYAAGKRVLLFAAASNNRANRDNSIGYPARAEDLVFCINSSNGQDERSRFSPHARAGRLNFSVVGECLKAAWPPDKCGEDEQHYRVLSGTSCATPVAAGIAALVLEFSRRDDIDPPIINKEDLRSRAGMKQVIYQCMTDQIRQGDRYNYIKPLKLFGQKAATV